MTSNLDKLMSFGSTGKKEEVNEVKDEVNEVKEEVEPEAKSLGAEDRSDRVRQMEEVQGEVQVDRKERIMNIRKRPKPYRSAFAVAPFLIQSWAFGVCGPAVK